MSDDFLNEARANWRGLDEEVGHMARRLHRQRVLSRLAVLASFAGTGVAVAAGAWLLFSGLDVAHALLGRIAGLVLLVAVPVLSVASYLARRRQPRWEEETPEGILRYALKQLEVDTALLKVTRWHAYVLAGFLAVLWVGAGFGWIPRDDFLIGFTILYLVTSGAAFLWVRLRQQRIMRERARCEALLAEYQ